ncbi:DUF4386 family protein [Chloroflexales bacterium ZM16-3]|nr:DUF4386 family protein [Chloroflexales bacterium ZM16-3]
MGGAAALIEAATFVIGMGLMFTVLAPYGLGELDPAQTVAFLAENQAIMYVWNQIIYVVFGIALVVLSLALHARVQAGAPALMQTATAFGLIWAGLVIASGMVFNLGVGAVVALYGTDPALAGSTWLAISAVQDGLGGGNEIVGGVWVLLLSWAALRAGELPKALNYLGLALGVAGLLTVVPALEVLTAVFGLGLIVWFAWVGVAMIRRSSSAASVSASLSPSGVA